MQQYMSPSQLKTQDYLNDIATWTDENLMKLNVSKSNYIIFSRSKSDFTTRLQLNNQNLERVNAVKILGIWLTEDLSFDKNTREICRKAYQRMSMLTKLKYVGIKTEDLIDIYIFSSYAV